MQQNGQDDISFLINEHLEKNTTIQYEIGEDGFLQLEQQFPFLLFFHQAQGATQLASLIKGESSYLLLPENTALDEPTKDALNQLIAEVSATYGGFLLIEIEVSPSLSQEIYVDYHQPQARNSAELLASELESLVPLYKHLDIKYQESEEGGYISQDFLKKTSSTWLRVRLPNIFYHPEREERYSVLLRNFRENFSDALRQTIFQFMRVQTSFKLSKAHLLGRSTVDEAFWEADRRLYEIQHSFEFLMMISAINTDSAWQEFKVGGYKKAPRFYYRLLPVDPEALKYALYSIRIDDIHDSMLAYLMRDKRNELNKQLDMLQERGSEDFLYSSIRLYKSIDTPLLEIATRLLDALPSRGEDGGVVSAKAFAGEARKEFDFFKEQDPEFSSEIHIGDDFPGLMVSLGQLYVPDNSHFRQNRVNPLIQHEVGTHVLTYYNGLRQPIKLLSLGLADYDELQEGLAVLAEYLSGTMDPLRMRLLAARVIVAHMRMQDVPFTQTFSRLVEEFDFTPETAFNLVARIYQSGGFTKDLIYLRGFVKMWEYLKGGGDINPLFLGKIGFSHIEIIESLRERNILHPARLIPRYWHSAESQRRLESLRQTNHFLDLFTKD